MFTSGSSHRMLSYELVTTFVQAVNEEKYIRLYPLICTTEMLYHIWN